MCGQGDHPPYDEHYDEVHDVAFSTAEVERLRAVLRRIADDADGAIGPDHLPGWAEATCIDIGGLARAALRQTPDG